MIDVSKAVHEDTFFDDNYGTRTFYFRYPKDMSLADFQPEKEYGTVVSMCIALEVDLAGRFVGMMASPTVEDEGLYDVDWVDLDYCVQYDEGTINQLLRKADFNPQDILSRLREAADQIKKGICSPAHAALMFEAADLIQKMAAR